MSDTQPIQTELFEVAELPGRPMLHWHGKRPLREIPYYPAQLRERYGHAPSPSQGEGWGEGVSEGWVNRLYWGDNLQIMAHLMREFRGKIKLIYIDPPFDSGADYRKRIKLRGTSVQTDLNVLEERQYTDIWSNDLYLQYMYERLILMRELLAKEGGILLHCDYRRNMHLRCLLDEVFGPGNFRNEIIVRRGVKSLQAQFDQIDALASGNDTIYLYSKSVETRFRKLELKLPEARPGTWNNHWRGTDRPTMRYKLLGITPTHGQWRWSKVRSLQAVENYEQFLQVADQYASLDDYYLAQKAAGRELDFIRLSQTGKPEHYVPPTETKLASNLWTDISAYNAGAPYPTQKSEVLLERIITWLTNPGDLVADFFIGSGTTAAVAQKLGRRWIGADINLGAIHTTAQRLARIMEEQRNEPPQLPGLATTDHLTTDYLTFEVYNVNHYEIFKNAEEARDIVLKLYGVEPLKGHRFFDGTLDGRWVKVVDLNRICSKLDIQTIFDNLPIDDTRGVVVLCAGHEYDVPEAIKQRNLLNIPFEVRDILTDRKDVIFKRPPEAQTRLLREDGFVTLVIEQFYSPLLLQKLSLEDDPEAIEDWRQIVASVLIDPAYDGEVFHARITDTPARRDELVCGEYTWEAREYGEGRVAVKIVDVLDEEWFGVMEE